MNREQLTELLQKKSVAVGVSSALSFISGAGLAYIWVSKREKAKYEELAKKDVEEAKQFYNKASNETEVKSYSDPKEAMMAYQEKAKDMLEELKYAPADSEEEEVEEIPQPEHELVEKRNIFKDSDPKSDFDYDLEVASRDPDRPYVITQEEFMDNPDSYDQITFTYFEGDDVVADERDQPLEDVDGIIGAENLVRFGQGSKDNNIVYIRNEAIDTDFEILRSNGSYAQEVLGFKHSDTRSKVRKFRKDLWDE